MWCNGSIGSCHDSGIFGVRIPHVPQGLIAQLVERLAEDQVAVVRFYLSPHLYSRSSIGQSVWLIPKR